MSLANPSTFFSIVKAKLLGPSLSKGEVDGCNSILTAMQGAPLSWTAYAFATAYRETATTMQPIKEYGGPTYYQRMYDVAGARPHLAIQNGNTCVGDGLKYCGRGYVQLTWKNNYKRAGSEIGVDLIGCPDLAMQIDNAARIMREGMSRGWFTGRGFADYLPAKGTATLAQYEQARRIINGTDHADEIAEHAKEFETALIAGGWS